MRDQRYAQHFLRSPRLVAELIGHSNIRKNDTVVDLGAGSGVISSVLARRARQVVAVEVEPVALEKLHKNLDHTPNVLIVKADILRVKLPDEPYKVFANIPFSLTADIVWRLTHEQPVPKSIYLIVQKQFAWKLVPSDRHFTGQLGAQLAPWWQVRIRKPLRKTDFTPPPAVDTVLLELKPRDTATVAINQREAYEQFVATCYERQKIYQSLSRTEAGIHPERKPSELTPAQWLALYELNKEMK